MYSCSHKRNAKTMAIRITDLKREVSHIHAHNMFNLYHQEVPLGQTTHLAPTKIERHEVGKTKILHLNERRHNK
jgi:hypothetical protein